MLARAVVALSLILIGCPNEPPVSAPVASVSASPSAAPAAPVASAAPIDPLVQSIRDQVAAIDKLELKKTVNEGCDGHNEKFVDRAGRIRILAEEGGEGPYAGRTTVYFDEQKHPIFLHGQELDESQSLATESRVYFDITTGRTLSMSVREAKLSKPDSPASISLTTPDRAPTSTERIDSSANWKDPEAFFKQTRCGK